MLPESNTKYDSQRNRTNSAKYFDKSGNPNLFEIVRKGKHYGRQFEYLKITIIILKVYSDDRRLKRQ